MKNRRKTTEEFINEARKIHGKKYDYSRVEYVNSRTKVCIICPEHGEFWQTPNSHLNGIGCGKCGGVMKLTTEEFIERARKVHGDEYDYSKVEYKNMHTKVCIICKKCNYEFWVTPTNHVKGTKCPKCQNKIRNITSVFMEKARKIHDDKYDYSKVICNKANDLVEIICPIHGSFFQKVNYHLCGNGCPKCGYNKVWDKRGRITSEEFIEKAKLVHGDEYDYSKVNYKNNRSKVCIICLEHGEFWQTPNSHLNGQGCPKCRNSKLEKKIRVLLEELKIEFYNEKTFKWLINENNNHLYVDFYLPEFKLVIECQGIQHFIPIKRGRNPSDIYVQEMFDKIKNNDIIKKQLCIKNGINVIYFTNKIIEEKWNKGLFNPIFSDVNEIKKILIK